MKVKNILPQRQRLEKDLENIRLLNKYFEENPDKDEEIAEAANCPRRIHHLLKDIILQYSQDIEAIDARIGEAELPDYK
jgi:hypothetical protein